jgi:signal transduction histidine kinase
MIRRVRESLLVKILLSTSVAVTVLFAVTALLVQRHALRATSAMLHEEVSASFRAYESLWGSRAAMLASVSRILSSMSDVRAAFGTGDRATIRDTASELWARMSDADAVFLVTDPQGNIIASLGGEPSQAISGNLQFVVTARTKFPEQSSGFVFIDRQLHQVAVTPVYVHSGADQLLLNVVVAGYRVDSQIARELKGATGGSEFLFLSGGRVLASTLDDARSNEFARMAGAGKVPDDHVPLKRELRDLSGAPIGELWILRSFESTAHQMSALRRDIFFIYLGALTAGLALTTLLARKLMQPISELDRAAAEVARHNYDRRVKVHGEDEIGRLGVTFNAMCASIEKGREELIRQERISAIGRISTSIVHDLRNPLAAIYGGAEMLVDGELPPPHVKRLAENIYRASQQIQHLLQELSDAARGRTDPPEICSLRDVVLGACEPLRGQAEQRCIELRINVPEDIEVPLARARMERVFTNLVVNSMEAIDRNGTIEIAASRNGKAVYVDVLDSGPGIPATVGSRLFQPFASEGKRDGIGLGLALSRQTVLNHGGDLWVVPGTSRGAHFRMKLAPVIENATA